jgi:hypothetical protein
MPKSGRVYVVQQNQSSRSNESKEREDVLRSPGLQVNRPAVKRKEMREDHRRGVKGAMKRLAVPCSLLT